METNHSILTKSKTRSTFFSGFSNLGILIGRVTFIKCFCDLFSDFIKAAYENVQEHSWLCYLPKFPCYYILLDPSTGYLLSFKLFNIFFLIYKYWVSSDLTYCPFSHSILSPPVISHRNLYNTGNFLYAAFSSRVASLHVVSDYWFEIWIQESEYKRNIPLWLFYPISALTPSSIPLFFLRFFSLLFSSYFFLSVHLLWRSTLHSKINLSFIIDDL